MIEATVVMGRCRNNKKGFGIRMQRMSSGDWSCTWTFPLGEKSAAREGYDKTEVSGAVGFDTEYPGCPYCGATGWVACPKCGKLTCWQEEPKFVCQWCGNKCNVKIGTDFKLTGGEF